MATATPTPKPGFLQGFHAAKRDSGTTAATTTTASNTTAVAPGGGPGMVWVNTETKVYHKEGSRWYGKTKKGKYMKESEAIKAGFREEKEGGAKPKKT